MRSANPRGTTGRSGPSLFRRRDVQRHRRPVPQHAHRCGPAGRRLLDEPRQLAGAAHALAVELDDDVPRLDAGGLGGAVGAHVRHHRALGAFGGFLHVTHRDADLGA